jgi:alpha-methylacyl-CoA racemase
MTSITSDWRGNLAQVGREGDGPTPPLNIVGDFGGGGMMLAFGVMAALFDARRTGRGRVIDAAMVDGVALLMGQYYMPGRRLGPRGTNVFDSGAPFYDVYETADGRHMAAGIPIIRRGGRSPAAGATRNRARPRASTT